MSLGPLYVLLENCLFRSFAHFLTGLFVVLVWSGVSSLYILEIRPLSEVPLAVCFPIQWVPFFILMIFSLAVQKLFDLMYSHFTLSFISFALEDITAKILLCEEDRETVS